MPKRDPKEMKLVGLPGEPGFALPGEPVSPIPPRTRPAGGASKKGPKRKKAARGGKKTKR